MIEEDEIDLKELWQVIVRYKSTIVFVTVLITIAALVYAFAKTPIYEVKSNIQAGFIGDKLLDNSDVVVKKLRIIFNVDDKLQTKKKFISEVSNISTNKKLKNFIEIQTQAVSNEEALKKNKEVVSYLQKVYAPKIDQYIINTKNKIEDIQQKIKNIDTFETKTIKQQIEQLKNQNIAKIDEKIKILKQQDIKKLQRQIILLKSQNIAKIDEKIKFLKEIKIPALQSKIAFHANNLKKYTQAVKELYANNKTNDSTVATIASIQMVNYQNLILNSQNKLEDLKIAIEKIHNETILNLQREKENIENVKIKDLQQQIENIKNVTILNLQREKENIQKDRIRKLQHQLLVGLPQTKVKLQQQIKQLQFNISSGNIHNYKVVGEYIVHDYPVKPKKRLIVIVAFITGLILSIFLAFFLDFILKSKEDR